MALGYLLGHSNRYFARLSFRQSGARRSVAPRASIEDLDQIIGITSPALRLTLASDLTFR
jgi:hypothetical protein